MRRHALKLGIISLLLLVPLVSTGAAPPTPTTPSAPGPQEHCVNWTVPDMHPTPEVQRRLDEIKAKEGRTLIPTKTGKRVCFATEQEKQQWLQQNGPREYKQWLQTQPDYQEYLKSRPSARKSGSDASPLTIENVASWQDPMSATLD